MIKSEIKESVHEQLDKKLKEYPVLIEYCKEIFDKFLSETRVPIGDPQVRTLMPVAGWVDSGLPLDKVVDFEIHHNRFIFKVNNAPYSEEQERQIFAGVNDTVE